MTRRFYVFNSEKKVKEHIEQVCTLSDCLQLESDIAAADCNLTRFRSGNDGVFAIDCMASSPTYRHLFFTPSAFENHGGETMAELKEPHTGYTILKL